MKELKQGVVLSLVAISIAVGFQIASWEQTNNSIVLGACALFAWLILVLPIVSVTVAQFCSEVLKENKK